MRRRSEVRLSLGAGTVRKVLAVGMAALAAPVAGLLLWMVFDLMYESVAEGPFNLWGELVPHLVVSAVAFAGLYVLGAWGYLTLVIVRGAMFVDGTMLGERMLFRKRWVDLSTAEIDTTYDSGSGIVRMLVARVPGEEEVTMELLISKGQTSLPAAELTAVADAITSRRVRTGQEDRAFLVADQLRELVSAPATQPIGVRTAPELSECPESTAGGMS